jgi:UrcA family protein
MRGFIDAVVAISGVFAVSWLCAPAVADDGDSAVRAVAVQFDRQELVSPAGISRVYRQLWFAAREACGASEWSDLARQRLFERCVAESLARAVADAHDAALTTYSEGRLPDGSTLAAAHAGQGPAQPMGKAEARRSLVHDQ